VADAAAARLLLETHATVAAIALDVGYESEAAFARAFKRQVGTPPAPGDANARRRATRPDSVLSRRARRPTLPRRHLSRRPRFRQHVDDATAAAEARSDDRFEEIDRDDDATERDPLVVGARRCQPGGASFHGRAARRRWIANDAS